MHRYKTNKSNANVQPPPPLFPSQDGCYIHQTICSCLMFLFQKLINFFFSNFNFLVNTSHFRYSPLLSPQISSCSFSMFFSSLWVARFYASFVSMVMVWFLLWLGFVGFWLGWISGCDVAGGSVVVVWLMVVEMVAWLWYGQWLAIRWILAVGMAICGCSVAVGLAV